MLSKTDSLLPFVPLVLLAGFILLAVIVFFEPWPKWVRWRSSARWRRIKNWARRRKRRLLWAGGITATLLFIGGVLFVVGLLPRLMVPNEIGAEQKSRLENEHRATMAGIVGGLFILFGGGVAFWRAEIARRQVRTIERGQVTERFTRAIDQLGKLNEKDGTPNVVVRLGGIHALEQIARDAKDEYYWPVAAVLTAYVRESAPVDGGTQKTPKEDVQAALLVAVRIFRMRAPLGRMLAEPNFCRTNLARVNLAQSELDRFKFCHADLNNAGFEHSQLHGVDFSDACLEDSQFTGSHLEEVRFVRSKLKGASLRNVRTHPSGFSTEDDFVYIAGADFEGADITNVDLRGANLRDAVGLTKGQLLSAKFDSTTTFPKGQNGITRGELERWDSDQCKTAGLLVNEVPLEE